LIASTIEFSPSRDPVNYHRMDEALTGIRCTVPVAFALPRCLNTLGKSHVLTSHRDLENTHDAARIYIQPRNSSRGLRTLADEKIANCVATSALIA